MKIIWSDRATLDIEDIFSYLTLNGVEDTAIFVAGIAYRVDKRLRFFLCQGGKIGIQVSMCSRYQSFPRVFSIK